MSLKPSKSRSIAARLVLLFTLAAALLLCCGLGVLYAIVLRHAWEEDNEVLADKVFALRADLEYAGGPRLLSEEIKIRPERARLGFFIRLLDAAGTTVVETPEMQELLPASVFPKNGAARYRVAGQSFTLTEAHARAGGATWRIQVAQDRSTDDAFMWNFSALLGAVIICGTLASAAIAFTVTKRGLAPLSHLTQALERVGATRLHERVPPTGWPRELQPFVLAFDHMLDRLEDSFMRLSQFSADLAHELRTPVANLRGEAEVALTRTRTPEEYREVIESSVAECARLSGMIDSLLFLARAESADGLAECTTFDGRAAVEKIVSYYETLAEERAITIARSGDFEVYADANLFDRAVSNVLENALRHTAAGGVIEITVTPREGHGEIAISDTGTGIPEEHLARIFDRFYRVDASRSTGGIGLGLALVKSIMDLHGGTAQVESESGRGTTVRLNFPDRPLGAPAVAITNL